MTFLEKYKNLNFAKKDPGMELDPRFIFPRPWPRHCSGVWPPPGLVPGPGPGSPVSGTITITSVSPSQQSCHHHQLISDNKGVKDKSDKKSDQSK